MKKLLVTGAAGFIGSNFVHYFSKRYPEVEIRIYDKITYAGNMENFKESDGSGELPFLYKKDICTYEDFLFALNDFKPDHVVAFAAETHVDNSISSPQEFLETNILGTEVILRAINIFRKNNTFGKLVHISTDEVYGSLPGNEESNEDHAFKANSPYSASKASGDMLCRAYFKTYETPVTVIRGSNCYGPRQYPEKFIPRSLTNLMAGQPIGVYGSGLNIREWIFTEDFCSGVEAVLLKGKLGEAYNLGGGQNNRVTNLDIVEQLLNLVDPDVLACFGTKEDAVKFVTDRAGHDMRYALNTNKIKNELGWSPSYGLAEGLKKTVAWYQENKWWWKPLLK